MDNRGRTSATVDIGSNERSIGDVLKDIGNSIQQIVRSEIKLARMEMTDSARGARSAAIAFGSGGVLGLYAVGFLLLTIMFALEIALPNWLAALIVGVLSLIGAAVGISAGRARLKTVKPPEKTIQTVKEDFQWTKEQTRS
ncbi:MAG TPA: phage holin family protein [Bryobacteraceae bacterium]|nr:phage holin family protein [Bryobacteraceae bacterium]